jgi:hypothetical protein
LDGKVWSGCIWLRIGISGGGSCEYDNETSGSIKGGEFLDYSNAYKLLKKDSAPWS